jgi:hypothetical protein
VSLRIAGDDFAVPVLVGDGGNQIIQTIISRGNRGDDDAAFGNANLDRMAFMHFDLVGERFWNAEGETVTPFLENRFHVVDTLAIPNDSAKSKAACRRPRGNFVAGASLSAYEFVR